ncbi:MAG: MlaD family protein [Nitrospirota bacterium]
MYDYTKNVIFDYTKNLRWSRLKVGILVSAALVIIFLVVIFASNIGGLFANNIIVYSNFSDIKGLKDGAPVRLSGVQIGSVKGIYFQSAGAVRVAMSIKEDYLRFLTKDSVAAVSTMGILGDKFIELSAGTDGRLPPGGVIAGTTSLDIQKIAGSGNAVIAKLGTVVERLDHILYLIENGNGSASKFIKDPSLYDNLNASTKRLADILDSINSGRGSLGRIVKDDTLYSELEASARDLRQFTLSLKNSDGTLKKLVADKSLYENLDASSKKLSSILDRLDKGEGTLGGLTKNGRVSKDLEQTISDLKALIEDIKQHPKKYLKISLF